jgi:hypothetical protein
MKNLAFVYDKPNERSLNNSIVFIRADIAKQINCSKTPARLCFINDKRNSYKFDNLCNASKKILKHS